MAQLAQNYPKFTYNPADLVESIRRIVSGLEEMRKILITGINARQEHDEELNIKYIEAAAEPTLIADQNALFWKDTVNTKYYLVFRVESGTQKKVELI